MLVVQFNWVQSLNHVWPFATPWTATCQAFPVHHQCPELAQTHVHWVSGAIQPSDPLVPFSSCLYSFPASGSFPVSQFFTSGGQCTGVSASVLPVNIQGWFPLGLTGWTSLQYKGLWRVLSNTTVQNRQFFGSQLSLWSSSHIHTWLLMDLCWQSNVSAFSYAL